MASWVRTLTDAALTGAVLRRRAQDLSHRPFGRPKTASSGGYDGGPKTLLSCCVTRMKVVRFDRCLSASAPT